MKPIILQGVYGQAHLYATTIEPALKEQCMELLNHKIAQDNKIRIMPDTHAGKGCMIGTTMEVKDIVCPNLVGVDIGCGMLTVDIGVEGIDFERLDNIITNYVPLGFNIHTKPNVESEYFFQSHMINAKNINMTIPMNSIGTLGGGNHFIEIDKNSDSGKQYLIIHTGSRKFGKQIADYWQTVAIKSISQPCEAEKVQLIENLKSQGRANEISAALQQLRLRNIPVNTELATLSGKDKELYLHDMDVAQQYASLNRKTIALTILSHYFGLPLENFPYFETVHNYIDTNNHILRKGAISAQENELVLIPLNMRDGSLIARGKGNPEWNYSAPHGAGRLMSRKQAKNSIALADFEESMRGIYSTSVNTDTLDESPFAYKDHKEIIAAVDDTVHIVSHLKPIYNRKA